MLDLSPEPRNQPELSSESDQPTLRGGLVFTPKNQHKYGAKIESLTAKNEFCN